MRTSDGRSSLIGREGRRGRARCRGFRVRSFLQVLLGAAPRESDADTTSMTQPFARLRPGRPSRRTPGVRSRSSGCPSSGSISQQASSVCSASRRPGFVATTFSPITVESGRRPRSTSAMGSSASRSAIVTSSRATSPPPRRHEVPRTEARSRRRRSRRAPGGCRRSESWPQISFRPQGAGLRDNCPRHRATSVPTSEDRPTRTVPEIENGRAPEWKPSLGQESEPSPVDDRGRRDRQG